jgi:hypothetical protein
MPKAVKKFLFVIVVKNININLDYGDIKKYVIIKIMRKIIIKISQKTIIKI